MDALAELKKMIKDRSSGQSRYYMYCCWYDPIYKVRPIFYGTLNNVILRENELENDKLLLSMIECAEDIESSLDTDMEKLYNSIIEAFINEDNVWFEECNVIIAE